MNSIEAEIKLKEINGWYEVNDDTRMDDETKAEVARLTDEAFAAGSGYAALQKVYVTIPQWVDAGSSNNDLARDLLKMAAKAGYAEAMYRLAELDFLGLSNIERYAYLKLSDFLWQIELEDFQLSEEEVVQAEKIYEEMKKSLTSFFERGEENF